MLVLSPRYTFSIVLSGVRHTYSKLIEVVAYYPGLPEKKGFVCTYERIGGKE